jgi:uncharacterized protein
MKLNRFENPTQFYERVKEYLLREEAHHYLLLRICDRLIFHPQYYDDPPYLATVEVDGDIFAVAMRTPPHNLLLSRVQDLVALKLIAEDLYSQQEKLPGVNGLVVETETFARKWQILTGQSYKLRMQLCIHQLEKVEPIAKANGYFRLATESDRDLLIDWVEAFETEAMSFPLGNSQRIVDRAITGKTLYLWQDAIPVSMAGGGVATPNGAGIGLVYTPPEYRGKRYATSCVAALSQTLLEQGYRYCYLFTDLANPTSNHIYRAIGYQPVCDWNEYCFKNND